MSSFKLYCIVLLCVVMLASACVKKEPSTNPPVTAVDSAAETSAADAEPVTADLWEIHVNGVSFQGQRAIKGKTVTFGKYPQANEMPEPIEWIVLDIVPKSENADGRILLLSKYVLDSKPYDTSHIDSDGFPIYPTWAESDIRKWLNDTSSEGFLSSAYFTAPDQSLIVEVTHATSDFESEFEVDKANVHSYDGGADTKDMVFLLDLSDDTYGKLFSFSEIMAYPTKYALTHGVYTPKPSDMTRADACINGQCPANWWLRSPANRRDWAASVGFDGTHRQYTGCNVNAPHIGVRPAMWVRAD